MSPHIGSCRHDIPRAALNHERSGERYAYGHYIMTEHLLKLKPTFIHTDLECKLNNWRCKVHDAVLGSEDVQVQESETFQRINGTSEQSRITEGAISDAHARLHGVACQGCICVFFLVFIESVTETGLVLKPNIWT